MEEFNNLFKDFSLQKEFDEFYKVVWGFYYAVSKKKKFRFRFF